MSTERITNLRHVLLLDSCLNESYCRQVSESVRTDIPRMDVTSFFQQRYYKINNILLTIVGIWPFQTNLQKLVHIIIHVLLAGSLVIPQICALIDLRSDIDAVFECIPPFIVFIGCVTKLVNSLYKNSQIQILLKRIMTDWNSLETKHEREILCRYAQKGRNFTILYVGIIYTCGILFVTMPYMRRMLRTNRTETLSDDLPFRVQYFIDDRKFYYPILFHSIVSVIIYTTIINAVDGMFFVLVEHACGLLSALGYRLKRITENEDEDHWLPSITENKIHSNIVYCIRRHQKAIEFISMLESVYTTSFLFQLACNMIIISVTAIEATRDVKDIHATIKYGSYIIGQMIHLFFETWGGQIVIDHTTNIRRYAYSGGWHTTSSRSKKLLYMIIMRTNSLSALTAGKVIVMSFASFGAVVKTSISYYTVLRSTQ